MARIFKKWIMSPKTEIFVYGIAGITYAAMEQSMLNENQYLKEVQNAPLPQGYFGPMAEHRIKTILTNAVLARSHTVHAYLFSYLAVILVSFLGQGRYWLLPWLILSAFRHFLIDATVAFTGVYICLKYQLTPVCMEYMLMRFVRISMAAYMWNSVVILFGELLKKPELKPRPSSYALSREATLRLDRALLRCNLRPSSDYEATEEERCSLGRPLRRRTSEGITGARDSTGQRSSDVEEGSTIATNAVKFAMTRSLESLLTMLDYNVEALAPLLARRREERRAGEGSTPRQRALCFLQLTERDVIAARQRTMRSLDGSCAAAALRASHRPGPSAGPSAGPTAGPSTGPTAGRSTGPTSGPSTGPNAVTSIRPCTGQSTKQSARPSSGSSAGPSAGPGTEPRTETNAEPSVETNAETNVGADAEPNVGTNAEASAGTNAEASAGTRAKGTPLDVGPDTTCGAGATIVPITNTARGTLIQIHSPPLRTSPKPTSHDLRTSSAQQPSRSPSASGRKADGSEASASPRPRSSNVTIQDTTDDKRWEVRADASLQRSDSHFLPDNSSLDTSLKPDSSLRPKDLSGMTNIHSVMPLTSVTCGYSYLNTSPPDLFLPAKTAEIAKNDDIASDSEVIHAAPLAVESVLESAIETAVEIAVGKAVEAALEAAFEAASEDKAGFLPPLEPSISFFDGNPCTAPSNLSEERYRNDEAASHSMSGVQQSLDIVEERTESESSTSEENKFEPKPKALRTKAKNSIPSTTWTPPTPHGAGSCARQYPRLEDRTPKKQSRPESWSIGDKTLSPKMSDDSLSTTVATQKPIPLTHPICVTKSASRKRTPSNDRGWRVKPREGRGHSPPPVSPVKTPSPSTSSPSLQPQLPPDVVSSSWMTTTANKTDDIPPDSELSNECGPESVPLSNTSVKKRPSSIDRALSVNAGANLKAGSPDKKLLKCKGTLGTRSQTAPRTMEAKTISSPRRTPSYIHSRESTPQKSRDESPDFTIRSVKVGSRVNSRSNLAKNFRYSKTDTNNKQHEGRYKSAADARIIKDGSSKENISPTRKMSPSRTANLKKSSDSSSKSNDTVSRDKIVSAIAENATRSTKAIVFSRITSTSKPSFSAKLPSKTSSATRTATEDNTTQALAPKKKISSRTILDNLTSPANKYSNTDRQVLSSRLPTLNKSAVSKCTPSATLSRMKTFAKTIPRPSSSNGETASAAERIPSPSISTSKTSHSTNKFSAVSNINLESSVGVTEKQCLRKTPTKSQSSTVTSIANARPGFRPEITKPTRFVKPSAASDKVRARDPQSHSDDPGGSIKSTNSSTQKKSVAKLHLSKSPARKSLTNTEKTIYPWKSKMRTTYSAQMTAAERSASAATFAVGTHTNKLSASRTSLNSSKKCFEHLSDRRGASAKAAISKCTDLHQKTKQRVSSGTTIDSELSDYMNYSSDSHTHKEHITFKDTSQTVITNNKSKSTFGKKPQPHVEKTTREISKESERSMFTNIRVSNSNITTDDEDTNSKSIASQDFEGISSFELTSDDDNESRRYENKKNTPTNTSTLSESTVMSTLPTKGKKTLKVVSNPLTTRSCSKPLSQIRDSKARDVLTGFTCYTAKSKNANKYLKRGHLPQIADSSPCNDQQNGVEGVDLKPDKVLRNENKTEYPGPEDDTLSRVFPSLSRKQHVDIVQDNVFGKNTDTRHTVTLEKDAYLTSESDHKRNNSSKVVRKIRKDITMSDVNHNETCPVCEFMHPKEIVSENYQTELGQDRVGDGLRGSDFARETVSRRTGDGPTFPNACPLSLSESRSQSPPKQHRTNSRGEVMVTGPYTLPEGLNADVHFSKLEDDCSNNMQQLHSITQSLEKHTTSPTSYSLHEDQPSLSVEISIAIGNSFSIDSEGNSDLRYCDILPRKDAEPPGGPLGLDREAKRSAVTTRPNSVCGEETNDDKGKRPVDNLNIGQFPGDRNHIENHTSDQKQVTEFVNSVVNNVLDNNINSDTNIYAGHQDIVASSLPLPLPSLTPTTPISPISPLPPPADFASLSIHDVIDSMKTSTSYHASENLSASNDVEKFNQVVSSIKDDSLFSSLKETSSKSGRLLREKTFVSCPSSSTASQAKEIRYSPFSSKDEVSLTTILGNMQNTPDGGLNSCSGMDAGHLSFDSQFAHENETSLAVKSILDASAVVASTITRVIVSGMEKLDEQCHTSLNSELPTQTPLADSGNTTQTTHVEESAVLNLRNEISQQNESIREGPTVHVQGTQTKDGEVNDIMSFCVEALNKIQTCQDACDVSSSNFKSADTMDSSEIAFGSEDSSTKSCVSTSFRETNLETPNTHVVEIETHNAPKHSQENNCADIRVDTKNVSPARPYENSTEPCVVTPYRSSYSQEDISKVTKGYFTPEYSREEGNYIDTMQHNQQNIAPPTEHTAVSNVERKLRNSNDSLLAERKNVLSENSSSLLPKLTSKSMKCPHVNGQHNIHSCPSTEGASEDSIMAPHRYPYCIEAALEAQNALLAEVEISSSHKYSSADIRRADEAKYESTHSSVQSIQSPSEDSIVAPHRYPYCHEAALEAQNALLSEAEVSSSPNYSSPEVRRADEAIFPRTQPSVPSIQSPSEDSIAAPHKYPYCHEAALEAQNALLAEAEANLSLKSHQDISCLEGEVLPKLQSSIPSIESPSKDSIAAPHKYPYCHEAALEAQNALLAEAEANLSLKSHQDISCLKGEVLPKLQSSIPSIESPSKDSLAAPHKYPYCHEAALETQKSLLAEAEANLTNSYKQNFISAHVTVCPNLQSSGTSIHSPSEDSLAAPHKYPYCHEAALEAQNALLVEAGTNSPTQFVSNGVDDNVFHADNNSSVSSIESPCGDNFSTSYKYLFRDEISHNTQSTEDKSSFSSKTSLKGTKKTDIKSSPLFHSSVLSIESTSESNFVASHIPYCHEAALAAQKDLIAKAEEIFIPNYSTNDLQGTEILLDKNATSSFTKSRSNLSSESLTTHVKAINNINDSDVPQRVPFVEISSSKHTKHYDQKVPLSSKYTVDDGAKMPSTSSLRHESREMFMDSDRTNIVHLNTDSILSNTDSKNNLFSKTLSTADRNVDKTSIASMEDAEAALAEAMVALKDAISVVSIGSRSSFLTCGSPNTVSLTLCKRGKKSVHEKPLTVKKENFGVGRPISEREINMQGTNTYRIGSDYFGTTCESSLVLQCCSEKINTTVPHDSREFSELALTSSSSSTFRLENKNKEHSLSTENILSSRSTSCIFNQEEHFQTTDSTDNILQPRLRLRTPSREPQASTTRKVSHEQRFKIKSTSYNQSMCPCLPRSPNTVTKSGRLFQTDGSRCTDQLNSSEHYNIHRLSSSSHSLRNSDQSTKSDDYVQDVNEYLKIEDIHMTEEMRAKKVQLSHVGNDRSRSCEVLRILSRPLSSTRPKSSDLKFRSISPCPQCSTRQQHLAFTIRSPRPMSPVRPATPIRSQKSLFTGRGGSPKRPRSPAGPVYTQSPLRAQSPLISKKHDSINPTDDRFLTSVIHDENKYSENTQFLCSQDGQFEGASAMGELLNTIEETDETQAFDGGSAKRTTAAKKTRTLEEVDSQKDFDKIDFGSTSDVDTDESQLSASLTTVDLLQDVKQDKSNRQLHSISASEYDSEELTKDTYDTDSQRVEGVNSQVFPYSCISEVPTCDSTFASMFMTTSREDVLEYSDILRKLDDTVKESPGRTYLLPLISPSLNNRLILSSSDNLSDKSWSKPKTSGESITLKSDNTNNIGSISTSESVAQKIVQLEISESDLSDSLVKQLSSNADESATTDILSSTSVENTEVVLKANSNICTTENRYLDIGSDSLTDHESTSSSYQSIYVNNFPVMGEIASSKNTVMLKLPAIPSSNSSRLMSSVNISEGTCDENTCQYSIVSFRNDNDNPMLDRIGRNIPVDNLASSNSKARSSFDSSSFSKTSGVMDASNMDSSTTEMSTTWSENAKKIASDSEKNIDPLLNEKVFTTKEKQNVFVPSLSNKVTSYTELRTSKCFTSGFSCASKSYDEVSQDTISSSPYNSYENSLSSPQYGNSALRPITLSGNYPEVRRVIEFPDLSDISEASHDGIDAEKESRGAQFTIKTKRSSQESSTDEYSANEFLFCKSAYTSGISSETPYEPHHSNEISAFRSSQAQAVEAQFALCLLDNATERRMKVALSSPADSPHSASPHPYNNLMNVMSEDISKNKSDNVPETALVEGSAVINSQDQPMHGIRTSDHSSKLPSTHQAGVALQEQKSEVRKEIVSPSGSSASVNSGRLRPSFFDVMSTEPPRALFDPPSKDIFSSLSDEESAAEEPPPVGMSSRPTTPTSGALKPSLSAIPRVDLWPPQANSNLTSKTSQTGAVVVSSTLLSSAKFPWSQQFSRHSLLSASSQSEQRDASSPKKAKLSQSRTKIDAEDSSQQDDNEGSWRPQAHLEPQHAPSTSSTSSAEGTTDEDESITLAAKTPTASSALPPLAVKTPAPAPASSSTGGGSMLNAQRLLPWAFGPPAQPVSPSWSAAVRNPTLMDSNAASLINNRFAPYGGIHAGILNPRLAAFSPSYNRWAARYSMVPLPVSPWWDQRLRIASADIGSERTTRMMPLTYARISAPTSAPPNVSPQQSSMPAGRYRKSSTSSISKEETIDAPESKTQKEEEKRRQTLTSSVSEEDTKGAYEKKTQKLKK